MTNERKIVFIACFVLIGLLGTTSLSWKSWGQEPSIPIVSTRGHFDLDTAKLTNNHNATDYNPPNMLKCSPEIAIFIHGWNSDESKAAEQSNRTLMSLKANGYNKSLIEFSWDSNTTSPNDINWSAWINAKSIAKENGPKLAHFIIDYLDNCNKEHEKSDIRLISHSLGARVILSALENLHKNDTWNKNNYAITSVHLMAPAVDNEEVSKNINDTTKNDLTNTQTIKNTSYGEAIEKEVKYFYNLYNPADNHLKPGPYQIYPSYESGDFALGQSGYQTLPYSISPSLPQNYAEINVKNEILPICDADGNKRPDSAFSEGSVIATGDNHHGYMGYRNSTDKSKLIDDGAINIVIDNWKHIPPQIDQNAEETTICNLNRDTTAIS
jgi:hypothetical protein